MTDHPDGTPAPRTARPWLAFGVAGTAIYLTILDLFIVNVAVGAVGSHFAVHTLPDLSWVLMVYAIVFAAVLIPAGRLGDRLGRRRLFSIGLAVFVIGSLIAGLGPTYSGMLIGRAIQAIGAALATPNSLAAVLPMFTARQRPTVLGVWGAIAASGAASGPPLGAILAHVDWRLIFLINVPVGVVALVLIPRYIRESPTEQRTASDWFGAVMLGAAIAALTYGLAQSETWGWDIRTWGAVTVALALGIAVAIRPGSHPNPILEPDLFRRRGLARRCWRLPRSGAPSRLCFSQAVSTSHRCAASGSSRQVFCWRRDLRLPRSPLPWQVDWPGESRLSPSPSSAPSDWCWVPSFSD